MFKTSTKFTVLFASFVAFAVYGVVVVNVLVGFSLTVHYGECGENGRKP